MNVFNCLKRPSSKARQSLKLLILIHNLVSVEEEKISGSEKCNDKGG
jgi:hypothetical protein